MYAFHNAVLDAFRNVAYDYEIIYIDDGSTDATFHKLRKLLCGQTQPIKIIRFSRNFGKEAALYAGLQYANGTYISFIDADLQQPPALLAEMVAILESKPDLDVIAAFQDRRTEGKLLSFFKEAFYGLINSLSDIPLKKDASDFRTFRRSVADSILSVTELHRFSKGIFAWVGFETAYIPYTAEKRVGGKTKWTLPKLMNYAIDGIIGYSTKPLKMAGYLGGFTAFAALIYLVFVVFEKLFAGIDIPGYATIIVLILFLGGVQLLCIGVTGEYVGRIFQQSKQRPIYIIKSVLDSEKK